MKVFIATAQENWVCERFAREWSAANSSRHTSSLADCDTVWIMSPWTWNRIPTNLLSSKNVVVTIHHVVKEKFSRASLRDFLERDQYVDRYHVTTSETYNFISRMTTKPIEIRPFWANPDIWYSKNNTAELRKKYNLPESAYLVGSFQRDTEGHDLASPKLEKGPDIFCDIVEKMAQQDLDLQVVLAGWRRQYVINRLEIAGIKYSYFELPPFEVLNDLYNCLDIYLVSSRTEGGPQAIVECALTKTPIISTSVGVAPLILPEDSIYNSLDDYTDASPNVEHASETVEKYKMANWFSQFNDIFKLKE